MKKLLISLTLTIALVLTMLSFTAFGSSYEATVTIDGVTTSYQYLSVAVQAVEGATASQNATVKLMADKAATAKLKLCSGVYTLDLGGFTLDSSSRDVDTIGLEEDGANVRIINGSVKSKYYGFILSSNSTVTVENVNVTAEDGFYVGSGINATVSGCTVNATDKAFLVYGNLSSVGNTVESSKRSFWIEGGSVDVESGTYNASSTCVYVLNGSVANIYGGRYIAPNNTYVLSTNGGTLNVYGGQFSCASSEAMVNSTNGALKFKLYSGASFGSLFPNGISANVALSSLACTGAAFFNEDDSAYITDSRKTDLGRLRIRKLVSYNIGKVISTYGYIDVNSSAYVDEKVEVIVSSNGGYKVSSVSVTKGSDPVAVTHDGGRYYFTMPAGDVTVSATYEKDILTPTIEVIDLTYGDAVLPVITGNRSGGNEVVEYKKASEDDSFYSTTVPNLPGEYSVRLTIEAANGFDAAQAVSSFKIGKKKITAEYYIPIKNYDGDTDVAVYVEFDGVVPGDDVAVTVEGNFDTPDVGENKTVYIDVAGAVITGGENYEITLPSTATGKITVRSIGYALYNLTHEFLYDGNEKSAPTPVCESYTLIEGTDYTVTGTKSETNAGEYVVTYVGIGNFTGEQEFTWKILKVSPPDSNISIVEDYFVYDGNAHSPSVTAPAGYVPYWGTDVSTANDLVPPSFTDVGEYTVFVRFEHKNYSDLMTSFKVTIDKKTQPVPNDAELLDADAWSITIKEQTGVGETLYGIGLGGASGFTWQTSNVFEDLTPNTAYFFGVKFTGDSTTHEAVSDAVLCGTKSAYTLTFDANGGTGLDPIPYEKTEGVGFDVVMPVSPYTKAGHTFLGWSFDENAQTADYIPQSTESVILNQNRTLYAVWERNEYTVTYHADFYDGYGNHFDKITKTYYYGDTVTVLDQIGYIDGEPFTVYVKGQMFSRWAKDSGSTLNPYEQYIIYENIDLYASFVDIYVGNYVLDNGEYVTNNGAVVDEKPESGGYAHYKDGVLTLCNIDLEYMGDEPTIMFNGDLEIVLIGKNSVKSDLSYGIYVTGDLTISGSGSLEIKALDDGIHVEQSMLYEGGNLDIVGGDIEILSEDDGIDVEYDLYLAGGSVSVNAYDHGIDIEGEFIMDDGKLYVVSKTDEGIACEYAEINGGEIEIEADDDGIDSIDDIVINGGKIKIEAEDSGLESNGSVYITGGSISITSSIGDEEVTDSVIKVYGGGIEVSGVFELSPLYGTAKAFSQSDADADHIAYVDVSGNIATEFKTLDLGGGIVGGGAFVPSVKPVVPTVNPACIGDPTCELYRFTDLNTREWYHDGIHFCIERGIMNGTSDTTFEPHVDTDRAMIVTMLWRLEGCPVVDFDMEFTDVKADYWYTEAIRWATKNGIVLGYGDGRFGPDDKITREQYVTILYRYERYKGGKFEGTVYDVGEVSSWAVDAMCWALERGIYVREEGKLLSKEYTPRALAATMLYRYAK